MKTLFIFIVALLVSNCSVYIEAHKDSPLTFDAITDMEFHQWRSDMSELGSVTYNHF